MRIQKRSSEDYIDNSGIRENLGGKAVKGGGITSISRLLMQIVQLAGTMVLARILTPNDFGIVAMVTSISGLLFIFSDLGLTDATLQSERITQDQASALFWIIISFNILSALCMIVLSPFIARFYNEPGVRLISIVMSIQFVLMGLANQHFALLKRNMLFMEVSLSLLVSALIANVIAVIMAWYGLGYWSLVMRFIIFVMFRAIAGWVLCSWRPSMPKKHSGAKSLVQFGITTAGSVGISYLGQSLDKTLVGKVFGAGELGYYNRAFGLFMLPIGQFTTSLHHVAVATLSRLRVEPINFRRYYLRALSVLSFLGMPLSAFMVIASSDIIFIFFGQQWSRSVELFSILGLSAGIRMIYSTNEWIHTSLGKADRRLKWQIFSCFITIGAIGIGLLFGTKGVAIAFSSATFILAFPALLYAGKPIKLSFGAIISSFWQNTVAAASAAVLCAYIIAIIGTLWGVILRLTVLFFLYVVTYLTAIVLFHWGFEPIRDFLSLIRILVRKDHG